MKVSKLHTTKWLIHHPVQWAHQLHVVPEAVWIKRGARTALKLYKEMEARVPAYSHLLREHGIRRGKIKNQNDFSHAPIISKDSYLRKSTLPDLCWDGKLTAAQMVISATSGSSGEPFYFPRTHEQDLHYAAVAEMYLRSNFSIHKKSTLYIVGWGMGVWIGGVFSYSSVRIVAERGKYPLSIITPGTNQEEILKAVKTLGPLYDQVIIGGYPPMIKDLIDEGNRRGISWKQYNLKCIFSAEGFSEAFREYIVTQAGLTYPLLDTLNHYGTVDLGTMAHETPLSILVRRLAAKNTDLHMALFGTMHRQPTLAQYIPELFYFEEVGGRIICSARSGLPLVRYDLGDAGGVCTYAKIRSVFAANGVDLSEEIRLAHIEDTVWNLPFVYVFERSDFTVKLSGANIFPEEIRRVLEKKPIADSVTGKCTMSVDVDEFMNQCLFVHVELKKLAKTNRSLEHAIRDGIIAELRAHNSEYAYLYTNLSIERVTPRVVLWPQGDTTYFSAAGKHRWVRK